MINLRKRKIVFIGAGNMAEALARGFLKARLCAARDIRVADVDRKRLNYFKRAFRVAGMNDNVKALKDAGIIILAVKPQVLPGVLAQIKGKLASSTLVISIAAGITVKYLERKLGAKARVVRVMPNLPALVGKGVAAVCGGTRATGKDVRLVKTLFGSVGIVLQLPERLLGAVTALSGSGPAYVCYLVEAMLEAAQDMGLRHSDARKLSLATVEGAAHLLEETGLRAAELRERVTSKGGTTSAAIDVLEKARVKEALVKAFKAACRRAHALSR